MQQGYNTYWLDKPLEVAIGHKHTLSVEGGEKAMRYSLDLTYENVPGVMKESGRQRMGTMLLYRFKNLTFRNNMTYDNVKSTNSPYGSFREYATLNPYYPYQDENGNYLKELEANSGILGRKSVINPLYNTTLNVIDETSYSEFANNFGIDWYINADLRLKGNFAIRHKKKTTVLYSNRRIIQISSIIPMTTITDGDIIRLPQEKNFSMTATSCSVTSSKYRIIP